MDDSFAGEQTIAKSITLEILNSSVTLPPIPANGTKLIRMVQGPMDDIKISDFAKLVEVDPGLLTSVLKLANSSYYGGVDEIVSLRSAITRIGLTEAIHSICLFLFKGILPKFPLIKGFSSKSYWDFSWTCAQANRHLGHPNLGMDVIPGQLYLAGLLQGIGKIMLAIHYPEDFRKCIKIAEKFQQPLATVENDVFGTFDCFIAANILNAWSLPKPVCQAVAFSQNPEKAPKEFRLNAALTQLSYTIAQNSGIGNCCDGQISEIDATFICNMKHVKLSDPVVRSTVIRKIAAMLQKKYPLSSDGPVLSRKGHQVREPSGNQIPGKGKKKKGLIRKIKSWFS